MAGEHEDAVARVGHLIATVHSNSICYLVQARAYTLPRRVYHHSHFQQAYMYLLLGNLHMECSDNERAIQSFEHARTQMRHYGGRPLLVVSLVSFLMGVSPCVEIARRL